MNNKRGAMLQIHFSVLLLGLSGVFAKMLTQNPIVLTFMRLVFSLAFLFVLMRLKKANFRLQLKADYLKMAGLGLLLAANWVAFYYSIQLSTVAIGLLTFSTFPIFVTFLEPLIMRKSLKLIDAAMSGIVFLGIYIVAGDIRLDSKMMWGFIIGIFSGLTYAILSIVNKKLTEDYDGEQITFYEQVFAAICLLPFMFLIKSSFTLGDIGYLAILGILCTGVAHLLFVNSLKHISVQIASIITCLEPIYSIVFAFFLLGEAPTANTYIGGGIILGSIVLSTLLENVKQKKLAEVK